MEISIKILEKRDISGVISAFTGSEWRIDPGLFENYLAEEENGERVILIAYVDGSFAGYVTIKWQPEYPPFAVADIPIFSDLRVLREFRRCGVATALVDEAEKRTFERSSVVGIGVGMYADYGPAQRMYVLRGYVPDGRGLFHGNTPVVPGEDVRVDDSLALYFIKRRE